MLFSSIERGSTAEKQARDYLVNQGLKTIAQNFRCPRGEIDLIMQHNDSLVFVEVRFRKNSDYGSGAETVTYKKQAKLILAAQTYLQKNPKFSSYPARFDVISISNQHGKNTFNWIQNAFQS